MGLEGLGAVFERKIKDRINFEGRAANKNGGGQDRSGLERLPCSDIALAA